MLLKQDVYDQYLLQYVLHKNIEEEKARRFYVLSF
jgi:hypothetical protein